MNRLRRLAHLVLTAPARFEEWVDSANDDAFFAFCDAATPFVFTTFVCGLAGLVIAGALIHCLKP